MPAPLADVGQVARALGLRADYGHGRWFYGVAPGHLPRHAGYSLGYALTAAQLVHAAAATFLQPATA
ncbi:DUF2268 domain-containing putative Zn-dependent protease [Paracidovorax wautersii]|uniref:DUF2268 domain-containing putative Zn-dependent protease n=1 Tax=Paracidovorax wautersii TaxID=1177982 RepID=UPI0038621752